SVPAFPTTATSKHFPTLKPRDEHLLLRSGYRERLPVHFLRRQFEVAINPARDRMAWIAHPQSLFLVGFAPRERTRGAHQSTEDFRIVRRVQHDEPHAFEHALLHAIDDFVLHFVVSHVPPPRKHIRFREAFLRQSVITLLQRR